MNNVSVVQIFLDLVQIDSPTGHEQGVALWIVDYLKSIGIQSKIDHVGNVISKLSGNTQFEPYLLSAHMDTVEPGRGINPTIDNQGWIRSDGTTILGADNKAAIAIILATLSEYQHLPMERQRPLEIVFTVSEESGNIGAAELDYSSIHANKGYLFDNSGAIGDVSITSPAYMYFEINLFGRTSHASKPQLGLNIIPAYASILNYLKTGFINEETLINLGTGSFGSSTNSVPGSAKLVGEIRSMNEANIHKVLTQVQEHLDSLIRKFGIKATLKSIRENGAQSINYRSISRRDPISSKKTLPTCGNK